MSKYPKHNQKYFYKYVPMDTAHIILKNGTFRYSSPSTFNDPFDIQTELCFPFDIGELPNLTMEKMDAIIVGKENPVIDPEDSFGKIISILRKEHAQGKYKAEHIKQLLTPQINYLTEIIENTRIEYNEHWKNQLKVVKVFCVTEHNESILMWSHYAKDHSGVCFKLKVLPEKDNQLCAAKKVVYYKKPPSFFNVEKWIDSILLNKTISFPNLYRKYPLVKSDIWDYEDEWRVWAPFEDNGENYMDFTIIKDEIEAIYFGVNADIQLTIDLIAIAKQRGITNYFQSFKRNEQYALKYIKI